MKNSKFVALSFLAVSAVCGLASCGQKLPADKPGVIFRAAASILTRDKGVQKTLFSNKECADVVVTDEENLAYGKQDVVITIKPKTFFTCRTYDIDTWAATSPLPVHPYVGLGGPHALYDYPLQEGVAWTFKDNSIAITPEGSTQTFYKEEYVITVKKEFFKKNIVIDYGNVKAKNNPIYVYNSARYNDLFSDPSTLVGNFSSLYTLDTSKSSYIAASQGATITYKFSGENPYTFRGWDIPTIITTNGNAKYEYEHFEILGYKTLTDTNPDHIEQNDPTLFKPTVLSSEAYKSISFFIDWKLLAEGVEKGYAEKYAKLEVNLKTPTPIVGDNVHITADSGITVYPGGFFQRDKNNNETPYISHGDSFATYSNNKQLTFNRVIGNSDVIRYEKEYIVQYSLLFKIDNESKKNFFSIQIDGEQLDVDLVYGEFNQTGWRKQRYQDPEGETELPWWISNNGWELVQLNPEGRSKAAIGDIPDADVGKGNYFYLYTTSSGAVSGDSLNINLKLNEAPDTVKFTLDDTSQQYGNFIFRGESKTTIDKTCIGKSFVDINFRANGGDPDYRSYGFNVSVKDSANHKVDYIMTNPYNGDATMRVYLDNGETFEKGSLTIVLAPAGSAVLYHNGSTNDYTDILGSFVVQSLDNEFTSCGVLLKETGDSVQLPTLKFRFNDTYKDIVFDENKGEMPGSQIQDTYERKIEVYDSNQNPCNFTVTRDNTDVAAINISFNGPVALNPGGKITVKISFVHCNIIERTTSEEEAHNLSCTLMPDPSSGKNCLYDYVGQYETQTMELEVRSKMSLQMIAEYYVRSNEYWLVEGEGVMVLQDGSTEDYAKFTINLQNLNQRNCFPNGTIFNFTFIWNAKK